MKTIETLAIEDKKQQLSAGIDGQLGSDELELLIDDLLENSLHGEELRKEWKNLHYISQINSLDKENKSTVTFDQANEFLLMDVSSQISKKIDQETQFFPQMTKANLLKSGQTESRLMKAEIGTINGSLGVFRYLMAGSAIAASLVFVVANILNTETAQFSGKQTNTTSAKNKPQYISTLATSKSLDNYHITDNKKSAFVDNNSITRNKVQTLYTQNVNVNYYNRPVSNNNYSNLIHKVSLKPEQKYPQNNSRYNSENTYQNINRNTYRNTYRNNK